MSHVNTTDTPSTDKFFRADDFIVYLREESGLKISKSTFLKGVKAGKFPQPLYLSAARPVWRTSDVKTLIAAL